MKDYSLYLCTNSEMNDEYDIADCVEQAIKGGVTIVQIREKNKSIEEFLRIAKKIKKITDYYEIPLIINDNVEVALKINATGVHLGQNDMSCLEARKKIGNDKIIGVTVTNLEEAKRAILDGANYLGIGAIYPSKTKSDAIVVGEKELKKISEFSNIPIVVIGGINEHTIPKLKDIKIDGFAMIRPILGQQDIIEATINLKSLIEKNKVVS